MAGKTRASVTDDSGNISPAISETIKNAVRNALKEEMKPTLDELKKTPFKILTHALMQLIMGSLS